MYIYPLDDSYIHMSLAKTFSENGVYGINNNEFCSASSSPLYTFLLASFYKIFGNHDYYGLIFNIVCGNAIIIYSYLFFKRNFSANYLQMFIIFNIILYSFSLLHLMVLTGMEHTLHMLISLVCFGLLFELKDKKVFNSQKKWVFLVVLFISVMIRYESLFFIALIILYFTYRKNYIFSLQILFSAILPIVLFGIYSILNNGFFLPNSLLIKGNVNSSFSEKLFLYSEKIKTLINFREFSVLIGFIFFVMIITYKKKKFQNISRFFEQNNLFIIAVFAFFLHGIFANFGWVFRYESYLFVIVFFSAIIYYYENKNSLNIYLKISFIAVFLILSFSTFRTRIIPSTDFISKAGKNVYEQQYLVGTFFQKYYNHKSIVLGDLGAISYLTNGYITDLFGLGYNEVALLKINNKYDKYSYLKSISHKNDFFVYPKGLLEKADPNNSMGWIKMADFKIFDNVYCYSDTVSIYIKDKRKIEEFKENLKDFIPFIPKDVEYQFF